MAEVFGAWIRDTLLRYYRRTKLEINGCDFHDDGEWRIFYLIVWNRGKTTARACVGQLSIAPLNQIHITSSGLATEETIRTGSSAALNNVGTYWSRGDKPIEIAIHPGQSQRLVIGRARSRSPMEHSNFTIPTELGFEPARIVFSGRGYEFVGRVGSDNADPVLAFGRVLWSELNPTIELSDGVTDLFKLPPHLMRKPRWRRWARLMLALPNDGKSNDGKPS